MNRVALPVLRTERLTVAPFTEDHARDVDRFEALWDVARYTTGIPHPYPPGDAFLYAHDVALERHNGAGGLAFAVLPKADKRVVGMVELDLADDGRSAELGYAYAPDVWGRGFAVEAAEAIISWAFGDAGLDALVASAHVDNHASCRVLQKTGFRRVGNSTTYMRERGKTGTFEDYRLMRREWQQ